ncbi:MAG TPA: hypothetical protein VFS37_00915 [Conexibacter sp.]|nr:hypothetical protein [Conexibacter sp.]
MTEGRQGTRLRRSRDRLRHPDLDVLVVALATTAGWRGAVPALLGAIERAGARAAVASAAPTREVRTFALTDLVQARAARTAAQAAVAAHRPRALIYASATAALLGPQPGAIWFDSPAAENRPGRHGVWQRPVERRRVATAPLLLPMSEGGLRALGALPRTPAVVLPVPVEPSAPRASGERDVAALAYAADAEKKGLARILAAWAAARRDGETLLVAGQPAGPLGEGAAGTGLLPPEEYRALLRRARVFVAAPRHEDYGIAQLEALADGCRLVTTPGAGPYPARELARTLEPAFVSDDLSGAIRAALDTPTDDYAQRAAELLTPYRRAAFDATVRDRVLPALL